MLARSKAVTAASHHKLTHDLIETDCHLNDKQAA